MQRGSSLLEMLVTLALCAIVLTCAATATMAGSRLTASLSVTTEAIITRQKATAALTAALRALDRHRIHAGLRVMTGAEIISRHHPLSRMKGTSAPRELSDILSVLEVSPPMRGSIISSYLSNGLIDLTVCEYKEAPNAGQIESFLILGLGGILQITAQIEQERPGCIRLRGNTIESIFSTATDSTGSFHTLLPIEREYSLFVDRSSQIRLVSHIGFRIVENQPIARGISFIRINQSLHPSNTLLFTLTVQPTAGPSSTTTSFAASTRRALWTEILL